MKHPKMVRVQWPFWGAFLPNFFMLGVPRWDKYKKNNFFLDILAIICYNVLARKEIGKYEEDE